MNDAKGVGFILAGCVYVCALLARSEICTPRSWGRNVHGVVFAGYIEFIDEGGNAGERRLNNVQDGSRVCLFILCFGEKKKNK